MAAHPKTWESGGVCLNLARGMDISVSVYSVHLVLCLGEALRRADLPFKESYRFCLGLRY
jgi:hypothetical protein